MSKNILYQLKNVSKIFKQLNKNKLVVLNNINISLYEGEIIALIGKSGAGKSTLLRIIAGLMETTSGHVLYKNKLINGPISNIAIVFQNFALMPWLTVLENVSLGLEARGVSFTERRNSAIKSIDLIGMDGFENAYPKELSDGMKQRVSLARALVVEPELLIMDEPFSNLDILTAETLRNDLIEIWNSPSNRIKSIIFVTHNIEEAILLADKILVLSNKYRCIEQEININLTYPRNRASQEFIKIVDKVYRLMTDSEYSEQKVDKNINYYLPNISVEELIGLLEEVGKIQKNGLIGLTTLTESIRLDIDDLFPILESLSILKLANISHGEIAITKKGLELIRADITETKILFAKSLMDNIPLAQYIINRLKLIYKESEDHFLLILSKNFSQKESEEILTTIIDWGRYAELFSYNYDTGMLSLDDVN
jgi:NitT/TauT family transport system ATP-binding protein